MSIQLIQKEDRNPAINVENPMNISDLLIRQSPSRSDRTVSQPLFPASGASRTPPPRVDISNVRRSFPSQFTRDDRRPSSRVRERRDSRQRESRRRDSHQKDSRDHKDSRRRDSRRRDSRDRRDKPSREDRKDRGALTDTEPVELDLLANPKKKKKSDPLEKRAEEDFSDNSHDAGRKDDFVRDDERFDFEKKNRIDSRHGDTHKDSRHDDSRRRDSRHDDSRRRDSRHGESRRDSRHDDSRRRDSRHGESRRDSRHDDSRRRDSRHDDRRQSNTHSRGDGWSGFGSSPKYMNYEEEQQRKQRVLERFDKLMRRGVQVNKRFLDVSAQLSEQESEADRLEKHIEVEESIQFQRKAYMAVCTGVEFLNKRYNPIGLYLSGWSESVMEDIETYDPVFEDLYEKYHTQVSMSPEFKLVFMGLSSMFMYHLSNTLFKSQMPNSGTDQDMMKTMRRSAMGAAGSMMGTRGPRSGMNNLGMGGMRPPPPQSFQQSGGPSSFSREMRGPNTNTNDLLSEYMDRNPNNINDTILHEIDDILDNPSEEDDNKPSVRNVAVSRQAITLDL